MNNDVILILDFVTEMVIEDGGVLPKGSKNNQPFQKIMVSFSGWHSTNTNLSRLTVADACDNISAVLKQRFLFWPSDGALHKHAVLTSPLAINWESTKVAFCESTLPSTAQQKGTETGVDSWLHKINGSAEFDSGVKCQVISCHSQIGSHSKVFVLGWTFMRLVMAVKCWELGSTGCTGEDCGAVKVGPSCGRLVDKRGKVIVPTCDLLENNHLVTPLWNVISKQHIACF